MRIKYTEKKINKFILDGRGSGERAFYKPWILTRELKGASSRKIRVKGQLTGRVHHLLSDLEKKIFFLLEWRYNVYDIREQYPLLPNNATIRIAEENGLRHSKYPYTGLPIVMTTDFFVTKILDGQEKHIAICAKYSKDLGNKRVRQKIFIEKKYWEEQGIDFRIFTEKDINSIVIQNIIAFRDAYTCALTNKIDIIERIKKDLQILIHNTTMTLHEAAYVLDAKHEGSSRVYIIYFQKLSRSKNYPT